MADILMWEGVEYILPKKTLAVQRKMDEIGNLSVQNKGVECYNKQWALCTELLGKENAETVLDAKNINDVDLQTLTICYNSIVDVYLQRVLEHQRQREAEQLNSPALQAIDNVASSVEKIAKFK
ncbi:MAG: hypothetical protein PUK21_01535 [Peptostreptococcaceae bacterium]|nr:hypothetical protein [Peptostreptococcaceae bacterium]MDY5738691.1 hypothetical protein [Anaerovoracaceae bacterium]